MTSARRLTIVTPRARVDVALPVESTLAELVPQLVALAGAEDQASPANPGWSLSRLGGAPIEPGLTVGGAGLRDGDLVYLRPRTQYSAPMVFDDVVDAIASAAETRRGAWSSSNARRTAQVVAALALGGAAVLAVAGSSGRMTGAISCGALALLAVLGAGALARSAGDTAGAVAAATGGVPAAVLAGLLALPHRTLWPLTTGPVCLGLAAAALYGVLGAVLVADRIAVFAGIALSASFGAVVAAVAVLVPTRAVSACAVGVCVAIALGAAAPILALRLGRLPLPRVPADSAAFRSDETPTLGADVLPRTAAAEQILTGLLAALGVAGVGCGLVLVADVRASSAGWSWALAGVAGLAWVMRSRSYAGTSQRVALIGSGAALLVALAVRIALSLSRHAVLGAAGAAAVVTVGALAYSVRAGRGVRSPYWTRWSDVLEFLSVIAVLPLAGAVLGLYAAARGLAS